MLGVFGGGCRKAMIGVWVSPGILRRMPSGKNREKRPRSTFIFMRDTISVIMAIGVIPCSAHRGVVMVTARVVI